MRNTLYFKGYEGNVVGLGTIALVVKIYLESCAACFLHFLLFERSVGNLSKICSFFY